MCELLVQVADKPGCETYRCGTVIVAVRDGHDWTPKELAHPDWVVVCVPGMSLAEGQSLAAGEPSDGVGRYRHKRLFHLDTDALPPAEYGLRRVTLDAATVRAAKRRKPPVADPDIIGESRHPGVIGGD